MSFSDHFSGHAAAYAQARPTYPPALFAWLTAQVPRRALAWDAGCGNGQAAVALATHFERVVATDPSATQIASAAVHPAIDYRVEPAETPSLIDASVDLVTVAQALHWFDQDRFHASVRRVLRDDGAIAVWSYGLTMVDAAVDAVFMQLYEDVLGPYWPDERRHVESGYRTLPFPYREIEAPAFEMTLPWPLARYLDYLRTWSAAQRYTKETGRDAVAELTPEFEKAWGEAEAVREVRWPLSIRMGFASP